MAERGACWTIWGSDPKVRSALTRSRASLKAIHPELDQCVVEVADFGPARSLLQRSAELLRSPFETTLFLDADTVVLGSLDLAFQQAERFGIAAAVNECPWAQRYAGIEGELVEWNCGVLCYTREAAPLLQRWAELAEELDSSCVHLAASGLATMEANDQCSFAAAVEDTGIVPFPLPVNFNFRHQWQRGHYGEVKVWHAYEAPFPSVLEARDYYAKPGSFIQWHPLSTPKE